MGAIKWILVFGFFVGLGVYAYYAGSNLAKHDVIVHKEKVAELEVEVADLRALNRRLERDLRTAADKVMEWEKAYHRDVPSGELKTFLDQIGTKLDTGVSSERLSFVIQQANEPRDCEPDPLAKRFIVRTPLHSGANDSVSFGQSKITVTAEGVSAVNGQGQPEAWFDKDKALTMNFTLLGGEQVKAEGLLPLHHAVIDGDAEYRFLAAPGPRGFVVVTGQRCRYP